MKEMVSIFQKNKSAILDRLLDEINAKQISSIKNENLDEAFLHFSALDTVYAVDDNFVQLSPIFNRDNADGEYVDKVKTALKDNIHIGRSGHFISAPYVSDKTHKFVVTLVKRIGDRLIAFDFDLYKLLSDLKHVKPSARLFVIGSKFVYGVIGISLTLFALILVAYAIYDFSHHLLTDAASLFQMIFKSTIGLTLGLAIFDLSKNLLEHEVVFKEEYHETHGGNRLLMKFLISIVIALAIETLMMVFKIALKSDYQDTLYAVYLILAIGFMLIAMSQFNKYIGAR